MFLPWLINHVSDTAARVRVLPLSTLITEIETKADEKIRFIELPEDLNDVWQVKLMNDNVVNINPYTADILLIHRFTIPFMVLLWLGIVGCFIVTAKVKCLYNRL